MTRNRFGFACLSIALFAASCGDQGDGHDAAAPEVDGGAKPDGGDAGGFAWDLPKGFPQPDVPRSNPMSDAKVELGRRLFYDPRLSDNETQSCGSCHSQELAFTDGRATGLGSTGQPHTRGAMSLANVGYASTLTWANPLMRALERQAEVPLFGDQPIELGLRSFAAIEERLQQEPLYDELFAAAFPDDADQPITVGNMNKAIAAFQRTLISGRSPFDRYFHEGDQDAISDAAERGFALFNGHPFECFHCHTGFNFTDHMHWQGKAMFEAPYHNTGLYNIDGKGGYPEPNTGVHGVSLEDKDMGFFKAPSLRNIAVTAPYMHDGSIATLSEVLDHYAHGGRNVEEGENAGDGSKNPHKDPLINGFPISEQERADLIAFLESLTDEDFLTNPAFADPWE